MYLVKTIQECDTAATSVCSRGDKEKRGKLSPAGEHSLWSTEEDKSKSKACLTEPRCLAGLLDDPQRYAGDWTQETGGTFCFSVKSSQRMKVLSNATWCWHVLRQSLLQRWLAGAFICLLHHKRKARPTTPGHWEAPELHVYKSSMTVEQIRLYCIDK